MALINEVLPAPETPKTAVIPLAGIFDHYVAVDSAGDYCRHGAGLRPVSYTHLDVYKRQARALSATAAFRTARRPSRAPPPASARCPPPCGCRRPVRDVYKRQAYNRLNQRVNKLELNYDNFMEEFTAILHRQAFTTSESNKG